MDDKVHARVTFVVSKGMTHIKSVICLQDSRPLPVRIWYPTLCETLFKIGEKRNKRSKDQLFPLRRVQTVVNRLITPRSARIDIACIQENRECYHVGTVLAGIFHVLPPMYSYATVCILFSIQQHFAISPFAVFKKPYFTSDILSLGIYAAGPEF